MNDMDATQKLVDGCASGIHSEWNACMYRKECRKNDTERAAWWALVMGAAAALEDAANCLRDQDAKNAAEGAAKHYRAGANALWPNAQGKPPAANEPNKGNEC